MMGLASKPAPGNARASSSAQSRVESAGWHVHERDWSRSSSRAHPLDDEELDDAVAPPPEEAMEPPPEEAMEPPPEEAVEPPPEEAMEPPPEEAVEPPPEDDDDDEGALPPVPGWSPKSS
jgi:outer membrane biosynthesis protein TonB